MQRPLPDEHAPDFKAYLDRVPDGPIVVTLERQLASTSRLVAGIDEKRGMHRYAPGKWSVKELLGHLDDAERVMAYRALRFARKDATPLASFDEDPWVAAANFDRLTVAQLGEDLRRVRLATLSLIQTFEDGTWTRRGVANDNPASVRALIWVIAGHELHHLAVLRERYGVGG
jgi:hypothetical protein